ncbi:Uma2 family endonuclease [Kutzneria sp. NPDC052558]|uniref:Uma2 family endonuclease n=1 Tax=Kutzneria sp. NPDC052558 TaxID=3364121 RepID=UPI0037CBDE27
MTAPLWTLGEWIALPEDTSCRFELEDGVMLVGPNPGSRHQRVLGRLAHVLGEQLPSPWEPLPAVEVVTRAAFPSCVRVPDLVVVDGDSLDWNAAQLSAEDVLIAIEIIEPGTREADTGRKRVEYAEAGIRHYWMVDPEPPISVTVGSSTVTGEFVVTEPFPITIDLTDLTFRRERTERMMSR